MADVIVIPHLTAATGQALRLITRCAAAPDPAVALTCAPTAAAPPPAQVQWHPLVHGPHDLWVATLPLGQLARDLHIHSITVGTNNSPLDVRLRALPAELPGPGDPQPLRVVLSSCFYRKNDEGRIGEAVGVLRDKYPPHFKILCGDQVYLDMPVSENLPRDRDPLGRRLLGKYLDNWADGSAAPPYGYGSFLGWGANLFVSDDHEFWNNYPYKTAIASNTWTKRGREEWAELAGELFVALQTTRAPDAGTPPPVCFTVGTHRRVSFFVLDGRFSRTTARAYDPAHLTHVLQWIAALDCPGVLVLSQPLFEEPHGFLARRVADASLQDFDDHREIERALVSARHDIVVLSGDIHGGRVAVADVGRARIHEVIASPAALVDFNKYHRDPPHSSFPTFARRGQARVGVHGDAPVLCDHIALLGICASDQSVHIGVEHWQLGPRPKPRATAVLKDLQ